MLISAFTRTRIAAINKELRSFLRDCVLLGVVVYACSIAIVMQARSNAQDLNNASAAIVDEDNAQLSRGIAHAFLPPFFQPVRAIAEQDIIPSMNAGCFTVLLDATAMVQAGLGALDAATRSVIHAGVFADEHAVGR